MLLFTALWNHNEFTLNSNTYVDIILLNLQMHLVYL